MKSGICLAEIDIPVLHPAVVSRQETPEKWLYFFPPTRGLHFVRNTGKEIIDLCDGKHTVQQILEDFAASHNLTVEYVRQPVIQFIENMLERRVLILQKEAK